MKRGTPLAILLLLVTALAGCESMTSQDRQRWVDITGISEQIVRAKEESPVVAAAETAPAETPGPKTKALTVASGEDNPFLKGLDVKTPERLPKVTTEVEQEEGVLLNLDNTDIYEFIQAMAGFLDFNYIIDPAVKGVVNVRSAKKIPSSQLFFVFKKILNTNGLDIRNEGAYYYIFAVQKPQSRTIQSPDQIGTLTDSPRMVVQIVPVSYLVPAEAVKLLEPHISERGSIVEVPNQHTLIISDFESNVVDALKILSMMDISPLSGLKVRMVRVDKAPLFDLKDEIDEILAAMNLAGKDVEGISVIPLERVSSLLLVSRHEYLIGNVEGWIKELDAIPSEGRDDVYMYQVRNSVASDLAELVSSILEEDGAGTSTSGTGSGTGSSRRTGSSRSSRSELGEAGSGRSSTRAQGQSLSSRSSRTSSGLSSSRSGRMTGDGQDSTLGSRSSRTGTTTGGSRGGTTTFTPRADKPPLGLAGVPTLIADDDRNIIIIRSQPSDYPRLLKLIQRLDNLPSQVLVEVLVAEVKLGDEWQLGLEWFLKEHADGKGNWLQLDHADLASPGADSGQAGLMYRFLSDNDKVMGLLRLIAGQTDVDILSSPQVLVLNNETARVNVGSEVPVVTGEIVDSTTGEVPNSLNRSIQYRDTGVILEVTPKINANGIIILEVSQQVSSLSKTTISGITSPVIDKRELETQLAMRDGQSILIGGLIGRDKNVTETGIPILKDAPLFGWLFKYRTEAVNHTELLVMITPHVISSENVLEQYANAFHDQVQTLRQELRRGNGSASQETADAPTGP
ncbi:MAG: type II secretion system secretin GspD [Thermodesulfobacteriota bacterium]